MADFDYTIDGNIGVMRFNRAEKLNAITYEMLGMIDVSRRPYYAWQAYVTDSMAVGLDGTIYIGQSERHSRLYVYYPE